MAIEVIDSTGHIKDTLSGVGTVSQGDVLYGSATNTWSTLAKNASATRYLSNTGTSNNPAWAQIALANGVSGNLPITNLGNGTFSFKTDISTGTQNNLDLTILGDTYVEWSGSSDMTLTGVTLGASGKHFIFKNTGTKVAYFSHLSGSSSAANQFKNLVTSSTTPVSVGGWIQYLHNGTNWVMVGHEQGANITPGFSAGDWTGSGSMTVTVGAGDVLTDAYRVVGKTFHYWFFLNTVTVGGTPSTSILRAIPNSFAFTTGGTGSGGPMRVYDNGTYRTGFAFVYTTSSSTQIVFTIQDLSNYAASTNNSGLFGSISFEID